MKLNNMKSVLLVAALLLAAALPVDMQAQERVPFTAPEYNAAPPTAQVPLRADGNANGEIDLPPPGDLPVAGGFWALAGLAVAYGVVRRRRSKSAW